MEVVVKRLDYYKWSADWWTIRTPKSVTQVKFYDLKSWKFIFHFSKKKGFLEILSPTVSLMCVKKQNFEV